MLEVKADSLDLFLLEDTVWIACAETGLPNYDFPFDRFFACRRPWRRRDNISAIGRFSVTTNHSQLYAELQTLGVRLIQCNDGQERSCLPNNFSRGSGIYISVKNQPCSQTGT